MQQITALFLKYFIPEAQLRNSKLKKKSLDLSSQLDLRKQNLSVLMELDFRRQPINPENSSQPKFPPSTQSSKASSLPWQLGSCRSSEGLSLSLLFILLLFRALSLLSPSSGSLLAGWGALGWLQRLGGS